MNPDAQRGRLTDAVPQAPSPTMRHSHSSDREGGRYLHDLLLTDSEWNGGVISPNTVVELVDIKFALQDDGDATKRAQLDCANITAGMTRTYALPDVNGVISVLGNTTVGSGATLVLGTAPVGWTPTLTQGAAVTRGVQFARYQVLGKMAYVQARLTLTGGGTAGNQFLVSGLPAGIAPAQTGLHVPVGTFVYLAGGTSYYEGAVVAVGSNDLRFVTNANGAGGVYFGNVPSITLTSGDELSFTAQWEVA